MSGPRVTVLGGAAAPDQAERVAATVANALVHLPVPPGAELSVVLADDATLQALNRDFRSLDRPTDVLSFPADAYAQVPGEPPYLGDVVISVNQAVHNAAGAGHDAEEELALLAVHGLLHLLGYRDDTDAGAAAMVRLEIELGVRRADDVPGDLPL